jgi:hypothetical protein
MSIYDTNLFFFPVKHVPGPFQSGQNCR